jgi:hypothetical protein
VGLIAVVMVAAALWSRLGGPVAAPPADPPRPLATAGPRAIEPHISVEPRKPRPAPSGAASKPAPDAGEALPPLIPGSPLTDNRFAAISARIVIASVGLKQDSNWEMLVTEYMAQELAKEKLTSDQYNAYAQALYANPDRARAVGENIMRRVEQKLGTRVDAKALPMFGVDPEEIEKLKQKLK